MAWRLPSPQSTNELESPQSLSRWSWVEVGDLALARAERVGTLEACGSAALLAALVRAHGKPPRDVPKALLAREAA